MLQCHCHSSADTNTRCSFLDSCLLLALFVVLQRSADAAVPGASDDADDADDADG